MTGHAFRQLVLTMLGLSLAACAQYAPPQANCFNVDGATDASATVSTMGAMVSRRDTACDFVPLGAAN